MNQSAPAFPMRSVAVGVAVLVLIALASAVTTWIVSARIRTVTTSQLTVISAAERLQRQSEVLDLLAEMAVATGDGAAAQRYRAIQPELRESLRNLRSAIQLPENRRTFAAVEQAELELAAIGFRALDLAVAGRRAEARALLRGERYRSLTGAHQQGLATIEDRARAFVDDTRRETDRYLAVNFATSLVALLLLGLAWFVLVRPARTWARQLAGARRRAESATRAKSDFLAVMSHEIRTPLNSIIGFADLLLTDPGVKGPQRREVELIHGAGTMLLTVVNDLLDFSKIEAGRIELAPEPFSVETLVDNSVSIVRGEASLKGLELRVAIDPCLSPFHLGDETRLRQILLNLLNNAVKFTSEGLVSLSVARERQEGDRERIRFTITDTGIGIAADRQRQLFRPFTQADASITRQYGGTGLGLTISKRLVELMGGEIGFLSNPGQGSSFWFSLSLPVASAPDAEAAVGAAEAVQPACILVAEDLPMNQELARAMISRAGHQVDIVGDGEAAVSAVQAKSYDLVLMDIQMPRMDGIRATQAIRALPAPAGKVPIVAMTANVLPRQVAEFLAAGMNGHVAKPVRQRELQAAIAAALAAAPPRLVPIQAPDMRNDDSEPRLDETAFQGVMEAIPAERLADYVEDLELQARAASDAAAIDGRAEAIELAHRVVSQAGMLGLVRLSDRARALEEALRGDAPAARELASFQEAIPDIAELLRPRVEGRGG